MKNLINDWRPETISLIKRLQAAGFEIVSVENGEDSVNFDKVVFDRFIHTAIACDEARLFIICPNTKKQSWIYLVFGNNPGELVCDYSLPGGTDNKLLDQVTTAHYNEWELKSQPKCDQDEQYAYYHDKKFEGET